MTETVFRDGVFDRHCALMMGAARGIGAGIAAALARGRGQYRADGRDHEDIIAIVQAAGSRGEPWVMPIAISADGRFAAQQGIDFIVITDDLTALHAGLELAPRCMAA